MTESKEQWDRVTALNIEEAITLGPIYSEFLLSDPKCFGFVLARYKFAAKMLARKSSMSKTDRHTASPSCRRLA